MTPLPASLRGRLSTLHGRLGSHTAQCSWSRCSGSARRVTAHALGDGGELQRREQAHRLSRLFYGRTAVRNTDSGSSSSSSNSNSSSIEHSGTRRSRDDGADGGIESSEPPAPAAPTASGTGMLSDVRSSLPSDAQHNSSEDGDQSPWADTPRSPRALGELCLEEVFEGCSVARAVPLWRVQEVMLPGGGQCVLHVHKPHYCSMFERMFNDQEEDHIFGHLYLPAGSENLGKPEYALESGSTAPLVGTLMKVNRAVRTMDGKLIILATSFSRFKVIKVHQELPYAIADISMLHDVEWLDAFQERALDIAMRTAPDDAPINAVMDAASAAAVAGASMQEHGWLVYYELRTPRELDMWWEDNPREGSSAEETNELVQDVVEHGVQQVMAMVDDDTGHAFAQLSILDRPTWTAMETAAAISLSAPLCKDTRGRGHDRWYNVLRTPAATEGAAEQLPITSLNTAAERGITVSTPIAEASTSGDDLLKLELAFWHELDTITDLAMRVRGKAVPLPHGLLQLRPRPSIISEVASQRSSDAAAFWLLRPEDLGQRIRNRSAVDGTYAPEGYPPLRRILRLSYVAAKALAIADTAEQWQAFLECGSIAGRLRIILTELEKQRKVLTAIAALKSLGDK